MRNLLTLRRRALLTRQIPAHAPASSAHSPSSLLLFAGVTIGYGFLIFLRLKPSLWECTYTTVRSVSSHCKLHFVAALVLRLISSL
jgi:hypothetical protein